MKSTSYLGLVIGLGIAAAAACSPAVPPNNGDDGAGAAAPTTTGSADIDSGAGAESATGGAPAGGGDASGGAASTGSSTSSGSASATSSGTGTGTGPAPSAQTPVQLVAAGDVDAGGKLFTQEHCDGCHGTKEKGPAGKFPNLYKMKWDDKQIEKAFSAIKKGKAPMPPYGDKLQDKQIGDIVAWLKKTK